jgi:dihydroflavonol-4-reductase
MTGTVLVSGGSGYIAGFLIQQLIAAEWTVHATVRSLAKEAAMRATLQVDNSKLKVFAADLNSDAGWAEAVAGCTHVAHVASPFPASAPRHEDDLIVPARDGALRVLKAAKAAGVKRVVLTSSIAAIAYGRERGVHHLTEADWTNLDHPDTYAYVKSKTIAERAARDWVAAEGGDMEFCTINPALVLGPVLDAGGSTSVEVIVKMLKGEFPGFPDLAYGIVDVRDVADLHVRALTAPDMAGERFIASGRTLSMAEIGGALRSRLGTQARKVPTRNLPDFMVKIAALFDPLVRQVVSELGKKRVMDASHAKAKFGWEARPAEDCIEDCARSLIAQGFVKV